jgi:hypothetical protein
MTSVPPRPYSVDEDPSLNRSFYLPRLDRKFLSPLDEEYWGVFWGVYWKQRQERKI